MHAILCQSLHSAQGARSDRKLPGKMVHREHTLKRTKSNKMLLSTKQRTGVAQVMEGLSSTQKAQGSISSTV